MPDSQDQGATAPEAEDFNDFFDNALCGYLITNPRGEILRGNARLASWFGCAVPDLAGKKFSDLLTIGGKIYYETHLGPLLRMQGFFDEVALELSLDGAQRFPVLANAMERRDIDQVPLFVRITLFKATDRRLYEQNLRDARTLAETSLSKEREDSVLREQFIAVLGHDLRNPLGAITSSLTLLSALLPNDKARSVLSLAQKSSERMALLINDIMDFARGRLGGGMTLDLKKSDMAPVLMHVVDELRTTWPDRQIDTDFDDRLMVICDVARLSQLLSNLLANAITHGSSDGPIVVRATIEGEAFDMSVANTGRPIPPEALERLFDPFTREEVRPSQNGLGLGLYISSEIARAHGGTLSATSSPEQTRFTFRMPVANPAS